MKGLLAALARLFAPRAVSRPVAASEPVRVSEPPPEPETPPMPAPAPVVGILEPGLTLEHVRLRRGPDYVEGELYIRQGEERRFFAFLLEDKWRDLAGGEKKVYGATCIPAGLYRVVVSHSPRFGKEMTEILGVPGFEGIRYHAGRTIHDSQGCPLLQVSRGVSGGPAMTDELTRLVKDSPGKHYVRITEEWG